MSEIQVELSRLTSAVFSQYQKVTTDNIFSFSFSFFFLLPIQVVSTSV